MDVDDSDTDSYDSSTRSEFIEDWERMDDDESSDPEECGADESNVSNGSTLVGQSPSSESVLKRCSRCRCIEGSRKKSGVLVEFDLNSKTGKMYSSCQRCKAYADEIGNPRTNTKVNTIPHTHQVKYPQSNAPTIAAECLPLVAVGGDLEEQCWLTFLFELILTHCLGEARQDRSLCAGTMP
jgi:hypothetical protein